MNWTKLAFRALSVPGCRMLLFAILLAPQLFGAGEPDEARLSRLLPGSLSSPGRSQLLFAEHGSRTRFVYTGTDGVIEYCLQPGREFWGPVIVKVNRIPVATVLGGAAPRFDSEVERVDFLERRTDGDTLVAEWEVTLDGRAHRVAGSLRLLGKTLVVGFSSPSAAISGLSPGRIESMDGMEGPVKIEADPECEARLVSLSGIKEVFASLLPESAGRWQPAAASIPGDDGKAALILPAGDTPGQTHAVLFYVTLSPSLADVTPTRCEPASKADR